MDTISQRIKIERLRLGMTQEEFGKAGGVLKRAQFNYENGLRHPDTDYLERIAVIGADINYIISGYRTGNFISQKNVEVLQEDEREILSYYRKSPMNIRNNIKIVIAALANSHYEHALAA